ncbi:UNVERIFIED_CONTAM: hypothetical protein FKN15_076133 [Acipenser sinensis]
MFYEKGLMRITDQQIVTEEQHWLALKYQEYGLGTFQEQTSSVSSAEKKVWMLVAVWLAVVKCDDVTDQEITDQQIVTEEQHWLALKYQEYGLGTFQEQTSSVSSAEKKVWMLVAVWLAVVKCDDVTDQEVQKPNNSGWAGEAECCCIQRIY